MAGTLTICPVPIGNLQDLSTRQRDALSGASLIACEDTRVTGQLLERLGIPRVQGKPQLISFHEHSDQGRVEDLIHRLLGGQDIVLVSDAGTPTISDPGFELVRRCRQEGVGVVALPGPVAAMVALSASGLPTDRFYFEGFLDSKSARRSARLQELAGLNTTTIFYESPHRIVAMLEDLETAWPNAKVCVGRELTKVYEEYLTGSVGQVKDLLQDRPKVKGELVVVAHPGAVEAEDETAIRSVVEFLFEEGLKPSQIKAIASRWTGAHRSKVYEILQSFRDA